MSLPDTVFIFVLALIIFGPKKLPEIGRQLGKLVGEFRRASNEFKYQIEEELRQADFTDKPSTHTTIAASTNTTTAEPESFLSPLDVASDPAANLPVGQHPNIETLNTAEFDSNGMNHIESEDLTMEAAQAEVSPMPVINPAEGVEARTTVPYAATPIQHSTGSEEVAPSPEPHAPEIHHTVPVETEITHG